MEDLLTKEIMQSLNGAATLLMQIEPEDTSDIHRLRDILEGIAADPAVAESVKSPVTAALRRLDAATGPDAPPEDMETALGAVGGLIESAMNACEETWADDPPAPPLKEEAGAETTEAESTATPPSVSASDESGFDDSPFDDSGADAAKPDASEPDASEPDTSGLSTSRPEAPGNAESVPSAEPAAESEPPPELHHLPAQADMELVEAFIMESGELLTGAEEALLSLETNPEDMDAVSTVFRAFHTIKGTSSFLELNLISSLAHRAESLLSRVRDGEIRYGGGYADLALRSVDVLKELIGLAQGAMGGAPFYTPSGYAPLARMLDDPDSAIAAKAEAAPAAQAGAAPGKAAEGETAGATFDTSAAPGEPPPPPAWPETEAAAAPAGRMPGAERGHAPAPAAGAPYQDAENGRENGAPARPEIVRQIKESSVRVPIDRLDRFIDMVGELVVSHSMVVQDEIIAGGRHHELAKKVNQTTKIVRELQRMSMSMRMIPLRGTFHKMARIVRDLARKAGKNVTLLTDGEETEIDRNMVDIINDPLVHMVRNAVDHGIEGPADRERAGKPVNGTVRLSAYHSAGNVVVEIQDDGRGLDREAILAKALDRGLIQSIDRLDDKEIYNMIFEPGFSTAKTVSEVSGRGVGMDVVKTNIESLRGQVEIQSDLGEGSTFKMRLPLTLAIIDGMVVRVHDQRFVIPTVSIVRSVQPSREDLSRVFGRAEMIMLQGRLIPLFRLAELFRIDGAEKDPTRSIVVVVEDDRRQAGVMVDELIGSQQIVIKTLGEALGDIPGISGSAIMPNGRVGLILDVGGLVRLANENRGEKRADHEPDSGGADRQAL